MRIYKTILRLGTNADDSADYRAQRGKKKGFQGIFFKISEKLLLILENPGKRSGNQYPGRHDRQVVPLLAIVGHISR